MAEPFTIDHIRPHHVSVTPRCPPNHPACIRLASEYSVTHYTADEAEYVAKLLQEAARQARLPIQQELLGP